VTTELELAEIFLRIVEKSMSKPTKRHRFTKSVMIKTLEIQKNKCKKCKNKLKECDFDHMDGDSTNNSLSNCQALCPNCHAEKSRRKKQKSLKFSQIIRSLRSLLKE